LEITGIERVLTSLHGNLADDEAGILSYEGTHVADMIAGLPIIGRAGRAAYEPRGTMTQAGVAKELHYNAVYGTWSAEGGYNQKVIDETVRAAVERDCAKVGSGC
jgi:hypothetical protein